MISSRPFLALLVTAMAGVSLAQDNKNFERRMYDIYKSSYNEEISDQVWRDYIVNLSQRSYIVSEGDTLWDLSTIFFGDGFFWSKIWSYNASLTNPHLISVGKKIQFFTGSADLPPGVTLGGGLMGGYLAENIPKGFTVVQNGGDESLIRDNTVEILEKDGVKTLVSRKLTPEEQSALRSRLYPGAPSLPPPSLVIRPVLESLPRSFQSSDAYDATKYNDNGISLDVRPPVRVNPLFVADSFLYGGLSKDYPRIGRLVESENQAVLVGLNQQVYIRSEGTMKVGEYLTVMGRDYSFDRNGYTGDVIVFMGIVEVTDQLEKDLFRGEVVNALSGIKGDPWVSREPIPSFEDDFTGRPAELRLRVIGGGRDNVSRLYGQSDIIFLGGGSNRGLRVGDILGVYKRRDIRYKETVVKRSPTPIGHIKVFRSELGLASAFVLNSVEAILPGDETGPPSMVNAVSTPSEKRDLIDIEKGLDFDTNTSKNRSEDSDISLEEEMTEFE